MPNGKGQTVNVLVVGESWVKHVIHIKGFDQFHNSEYEEGAGVFLETLAEAGFDVTYVRAHEVGDRFPTTQEELDAFDVVVVSDVGANTFLLTDEVFQRSERSVNRLHLLAEYVRSGGGLVMVGGYLSFTGIDGKANFGTSPIADVLPVDLLTHDDRMERPEGVIPRVEVSDHSTLAGVSGDWPHLLGYNRLVPRSDSTVIVWCGDDPLLAVREVDAGRVVAFASDLAPHWAPPEFLKWSGYGPLWVSILEWASDGSG